MCLHQSFCILRFLTEGPPKRLSPPSKKKIFVFGQKIKSLCICYVKQSFMDSNILCQTMGQNFVSPFHNPESQAGFFSSTIHSGDSY